MMWNTARSVFDPLCEREGTGGVARGGKDSLA